MSPQGVFHHLVLWTIQLICDWFSIVCTVQSLPELASTQVSLMQLPPPHSSDMLFGANNSPARLDPFSTFDSF
jgi:hypothetical protein